MKTSIIVALFAALAAAAPKPPTGMKRCGGDSGRTCNRFEVCVGEKEIKDGKGVCVIPKPCGNFFGDVCPGRNDFCIVDPRISCPPGVMDCGGGLCLRGDWAQQLGLTN